MSYQASHCYGKVEVNPTGTLEELRTMILGNVYLSVTGALPPWSRIVPWDVNEVTFRLQMSVSTGSPHVPPAAASKTPLIRKEDTRGK